MVVGIKLHACYIFPLLMLLRLEGTAGMVAVSKFKIMGIKGNSWDSVKTGVTLQQRYGRKVYDYVVPASFDSRI